MVDDGFCEYVFWAGVNRYDDACQRWAGINAWGEDVPVVFERGILFIVGIDGRRPVDARELCYERILPYTVSSSVLNQLASFVSMASLSPLLS
jgi:hypothetical protein